MEKSKHPRQFKRTVILASLLVVLAGCTATTPYRLTKQLVRGVIWTAVTTYKVVDGTSWVIYKIGEFTFEVAMAPLDWDLAHDEIDSIDDLPPKDAIRTGKVKNSPYTVKGKRYVPMSVAEAESYQEEGYASWYGYETSRQKDGTMTANGERFVPSGLSAAHKYLPLPTYVKVTNLDNGRSIIVRVNDRGPFPSIHNARSGDRIIDLSMGAAKKLGFYRKGTARVRVEAIQVAQG